MVAIPIRERTIPRLLERSHALGPDRPFLVTPDGVRTYRDADEILDRLAGLLATRGIGPGSRFALMLGRAEQAVWLILAAARTGAVAVALNTETAGPVLQYYLADSGVGLVIVDDVLEPALRAALPAADPPGGGELAERGRPRTRVPGGEPEGDGELARLGDHVEYLPGELAERGVQRPGPVDQLGKPHRRAVDDDRVGVELPERADRVVAAVGRDVPEREQPFDEPVDVHGDVLSGPAPGACGADGAVRGDRTLASWQQPSRRDTCPPPRPRRRRPVMPDRFGSGRSWCTMVGMRGQR